MKWLNGSRKRNGWREMKSGGWRNEASVERKRHRQSSIEEMKWLAVWQLINEAA